MFSKHAKYARAHALLEKRAKILTPLQPHQERVQQRIQNQPGLVVAHGLGSGKTLASIAAADALNMPTQVVLPAALRANYLKELGAHREEGADNFNLTSLQKATRAQNLPDLKDQLLIVDEAHKLREPGTKAHQYFKKLNPSKRLFLTASPVYNHPADLSSLVNLAAGQKLLPNVRSEFDAAYTKMEPIKPGFWGRLRGIKPGERQVLKNTKQLKNILGSWVDYHESKNTGDYPTSQEKLIHVPMSEKQQEVQDALLDKAPPWVRYKIKNNLPPSKQEKQLINSFLTTQRQVAGGPQAFSEGMDMAEAVKHNPKLQLAFKSLMGKIKENPEHKAVIYSNYLDSGLNPYKKLLEQNKVPYGMFTGEMKKHEREQLVRDYNDNKIKALLLSTAGAEGLDLKGTRQMQLLDPHWNEEKMRQIIGRGIRYKSHSHLPEDQRNVEVERYLSQNRPTMWNKVLGGDSVTSTEEYLHNLSQDKLKLNDQVMQLLREQDSMPKAASADHDKKILNIRDSFLKEREPEHRWLYLELMDRIRKQGMPMPQDMRTANPDVRIHHWDAGQDGATKGLRDQVMARLSTDGVPVPEDLQDKFPYISHVHYDGGKPSRFKFRPDFNPEMPTPRLEQATKKSAATAPVDYTPYMQRARDDMSAAGVDLNNSSPDIIRQNAYILSRANDQAGLYTRLQESRASGSPINYWNEYPHIKSVVFNKDHTPHSVDYHRQFALPEELKKLSFDQGSNAALRTLGF